MTMKMPTTPASVAYAGFRPRQLANWRKANHKQQCPTRAGEASADFFARGDDLNVPDHEPARQHPDGEQR